MFPAAAVPIAHLDADRCRPSSRSRVTVPVVDIVSQPDHAAIRHEHHRAGRRQEAGSRAAPGRIVLQVQGRPVSGSTAVGLAIVAHSAGPARCPTFACAPSCAAQKAPRIGRCGTTRTTKKSSAAAAQSLGGFMIRICQPGPHGKPQSFTSPPCTPRSPDASGLGSSAP